jgi:integrative and conjugative element protein (TIGR02256 family)
MRKACKRAGSLETGGMLFAENVSPDTFRVLEATTSPAGRIASFVRILSDGVARLEAFFRKTRRSYERFNYLGEWHSHPSFALAPSETDSRTMQGIVDDPVTRALFVVLIIVKTEDDELHARAWAYFPASAEVECAVTLEV